MGVSRLQGCTWSDASLVLMVGDGQPFAEKNATVSVGEGIKLEACPAATLVTMVGEARPLRCEGKRTAMSDLGQRGENCWEIALGRWKGEGERR